MQHRLLLTAALALAACQSPETVATAPTTPAAPGAVAVPNAPDALYGHHHGLPHRSHEPLPVDQLLRVKRATARYQDVENAKADGYVDINVVIPNMGRHFLKSDLLDANFDVEKPELLVYSPADGPDMRLVAVEYAVPLNLSATAPEGFRGTADEWFANDQFQLWTLHAWVWKANPDGVFNATNSRVP